MYKKIFLSVSIFLFSLSAFCQINNNTTNIDYSNPIEYEIGGISVSGIKFLDHNVVISLSGLSIGSKITIPGEDVSVAIKKLWQQGLFSNIKISITKIVENTVFLDIYLLEKPRLLKFSFTGVSKSEADDIREKIKLTKGNQVTENVLITTKNIIKDFFVDKGFLFTEVNIFQYDDSTSVNNVILKIAIKKGNKIKINKINFEGNILIADNKLKQYMKDTKEKKWYRIFKTSKYVNSNIKKDKETLLSKYNEKGFRDAKLISDTIRKFNDKTIDLNIKIEEGSKYFFRNITWSGNSKHSTEKLNAILGIKKGEIFDQNRLDTKLSIDENSVSSIYLDNGYLFFQASPVEVLVENDSIDLEIRIYEGKQATIDKVTIVGNTRTNDHVIRREIRTKPGELFNRSDIIRTQRELAQLGYFDPEKLNVTPTPNPEKGTVDLEYIVEEKPSDQIELSGGWGSNMLVGTLGLSFNNFSLKNTFKTETYSPLPTGDGQRLSIRAQSNGTYYQAYNMSFVEPWLGGKKPNSLTVSLYHTITNTGDKETPKSMKITGVALGLGRRLKWPDDFFSIYNEISYQHYNLTNYSYFLFSNGTSNNISFTTTLSRSSVDRPIYPFRGSTFSLSLQLTPPYSAFSGMSDSIMTRLKEYKFIEYHKWTFKSSWFTTLAGKLVMNTKAEFGFLGLYSREVGQSPFEGYDVGGDGLTGYNLYGRETIALRGYENSSLTPSKGGNIYNKFTLEMRYPLSLNPSATFYGLAFLEGGNCWNNFKQFNPFELKRSAGVGIRIFLPMFGLLGVDWGYGFDEAVQSNSNKSQFHFIIGQQF
jgi:outer membrane protein insertion porin family